MAQTSGDGHPRPMYVAANTSRGWGVAAGVTLLAVGLVLFAWYYHNKTYHDPQDPTHASRPAAVVLVVADTRGGPR